MSDKARTWVEVDIDALKHNIKNIRNKLPKVQKLLRLLRKMLMVTEQGSVRKVY